MALEAVLTPLSTRERYAGLLYGALAADALSLGAHWIYDQAELRQKFGAITDFAAPSADGYHKGKQLGDQTHYGDQALVLMDSLAACGGNFVMDDFATRWRKFAETSPAYHDHATKETLEHLQADTGLTRAGSASPELGGAARIAPLLVALRHEDEPVILGAARAQTALTHGTAQVTEAAEWLARTVFLLMRNISVTSALRAAAGFPHKALPVDEALARAEAARDKHTLDAVAELGQSSSVEKSFATTLLILLQHGDNLEKALEENVQAGGDSAARGMVLGTILGAAHGRRAIPERWMQKLRARPQIEEFLREMEIGED